LKVQYDKFEGGRSLLDTPALQALGWGRSGVGRAAFDSPDEMSTDANPMKVYIAAPYECRAYAQLLQPQLVARGCTVLASWLHAQNPDGDGEARLDLAEIDQANLVVVLNPPGFERAGTGGRHVELGYALGRGKTVVLVGAPTNVFHHLTTIIRVPDHLELFETVAAIAGATMGR